MTSKSQNGHHETTNDLAAGEVRDYFSRLRHSNQQPEPPDPARLGEHYETAQSLYEVRKTGGTSAVEAALGYWEKQRPSLTEILEPPVIAPVSTTDPLPFEDATFIIDCCENQEFGDAVLLEAIYKGQLVYDGNEKKWYIWQGHHWEADEYSIMRELVAGQLARQYYGAAGELAKAIASESDPTQQQGLQAKQEMVIKRGKQLRNLGRIKNVLVMLESRMPLQTEWDSNPWLMGVRNGVIDLRTGQLQAGSPTDYIRKYAPTDWQGLNSECQRWQQFILEIFDNNQEIADFVQRLFGYAITGLTREPVLPIFWGKGRNGKDTLLETLGRVLGSLASAGSGELLIDTGTERSGAASPHLYDLMGQRLVWVSETRENAKLNTNQVKAITGGGRIKSRPLYGMPVEFLPTHTLILQTNHKPRIPSGGDDYALWQRLLLVPFTLSFVENPKTPEERKRDTSLRDKLQREGSGILAWLVRGCLDYQQQGLNPSEGVTNATEEYKQSEDTLQQFITECCVTRDGLTVAAKSLYEAYKDWAIENGNKPMTGTAFGRRMSERFTKQRIAAGNMYQGLCLVHEEAM